MLRVISLLSKQLGITSDTSVVLYDNNEQFGGFSAARAWLLFKVKYVAWVLGLFLHTIPVLPTPCHSYGYSGTHVNMHVVHTYVACIMWWYKPSRYNCNDLLIFFSLCQMFGHCDVAILDGGLPAYLKSGGPTDSGPPATPQPATYKAEDHKAKHLRDYDQMSANWKNKTAQVSTTCRYCKYI